MELKLGNFEIKPPAALDQRIAMVLWGPAGCGKTTLAATAPGKKLFIMFDSDGEKSLHGRDDVLVLDLSGQKHLITDRFMDDNPMGLEKMLMDHPEIETVVFDSATTYALLCTENAVAAVKSATMENPGLKGYGHRNIRVLRAITAMLRLTKRLNRHFIVIAHEDTPDKNDDGVVLQITLTLSDKTTNQLGVALSEIWHLQDTGKEWRIAIRPCRSWKPMKSRMFDVTGEPEFKWRYNANTNEGEGIADWFQQWKAKGDKISPPK